MATVVRETTRAYARQPGLLLTATVVVVAAVGLLHIPLLDGPLTSLVATIFSFCAVCAFIAFVLLAANASSADRGRGVEHGLDIATRARRIIGELVLLMLVMVIAIAILAGLLDVVVAIAAFTLILNAGAKAHNSLLLGLPVVIAVTTVPLLLLLAAWSVALPVAVHERPGGIAALGRSYELARGNRVRVFVVITLVALLVLGVKIVLRVVIGPNELAGSQLSGTIAALLIAPIPLLAMNALYRELERVSSSSSQRLRSSPPP